MPNKPRKNGRIRFNLTIPPALFEALKAQAQAQTAAHGGTVKNGGKGLVTVSALVEMILSERIKLSVTRPPPEVPITTV